MSSGRWHKHGKVLLGLPISHFQDMSVGVRNVLQQIPAAVMEEEEEAVQRKRQRGGGLEELLVKEGPIWQWFLLPQQVIPC